jgi:hypothetical protein
MTRRVVLEIVLTIGIAIALAWLILGVLGLADSVDPLDTLVDQTPRVLFGLLGIGLGIWAILVTIGAIVLRRRAPGARIASHLVALVIALVINVALLSLVSIAANGGGSDSWGMLVVAIAGAAGAALLVAGVTAVLLVNLVILRPKTAKRGVVEPGGSAE